MSLEKIVYHENVGHSNVWSIIPVAMRELQQKGLAEDPLISPVWNDPCLAMLGYYGDAPVIGFMVYRYDQVRCSWYILLAYVDPLFRRKGVHTKLFTALVRRAKAREDILRIDSATHIDNKASQAAFAKQGRIQTAILYTYPLRTSLPGTDYLKIDKP